MPIKIRVDVTEINDRLSDILPMVECCVATYGCWGSIITSTSEGENGRFADCRNVLIVKIKRARNVSFMCWRLKEWLGPNYNIIKDQGLIRIKWKTKRKKGKGK